MITNLVWKETLLEGVVKALEIQAPFLLHVSCSVEFCDDDGLCCCWPWMVTERRRAAFECEDSHCVLVIPVPTDLGTHE